jgi:hypothetical protein
MIEIDPFERVLLEAHARLHWLRIITKQNLAYLKAKHG